MGRDDGRVDDRADGECVVDGRGTQSVHRLRRVVAIDPLFDEDGGRDGGGCPQRSKPCAVLLRHERLVRGIQGQHPDGSAAVDDDPGRLRIQEDVELRGGGGIAVVVRAAHDHEFRDPIDDARFLAHRGRDVGQRADRDQRDVAVGRHVGIDQPVNRML